jgi:WhiB family redox-sensing transcriptional regulator
MQREREHDFPAEPLDLDWQAFAACASLPNALADRLFYPPRGNTGAAAKRICAGCDVRQECLEYALEDLDAYNHGIWGGTTFREWRRIRQAMKRAASLTPLHAGLPSR